VRVEDVEELLDAGAIFATRKRLEGKRIAVITTSGGSGILAADAIEKYGLSLAELSPKTREELDQIIPSYGSSANPVDLTAAVMADQKLFQRAIDVLSGDLGVDAIVAAFCVLVGEDVEMIATALSAVSLRSEREIPITVARTGSPSLAPSAAELFNQANIPIYPTPERAVRALAMLNQVSTLSKNAVTREQLASPHPEPSSGASEHELKEIWRKSSIPVPESVVIDSVAVACEAVRKVGGRAVMKIILPGLLHKSDAGGVLLDINEERAERSATELLKLGEGAKILVERFVPKGVEALVGITSSPLGKVLTIGVGGVLTEIIKDSSLRLLPVTRSDVEEMIDETRLGQLFAGVRGAKPVDRKAFVETVLRITDVTMDWESGFELDINPVAITTDGAWVLDSAYARSGM
jgi:acyl-CoA synthetase (NDP forming)